MKTRKETVYCVYDDAHPKGVPYYTRKVKALADAKAAEFTARGIPCHVRREDRVYEDASHLFRGVL